MRKALQMILEDTFIKRLKVAAAQKGETMTAYAQKAVEDRILRELTKDSEAVVKK